MKLSTKKQAIDIRSESFVRGVKKSPYVVQCFIKELEKENRRLNKELEKENRRLNFKIVKLESIARLLREKNPLWKKSFLK